MSPAKRARPVTSGRSSIRVTRWPSTLRALAGGGVGQAWCGALPSVMHSFSGRPCESRDPYAVPSRSTAAYGSSLSRGRHRERPSGKRPISSLSPLAAHLGGGGPHGLDDVLIAGAAAKIGGQDIEHRLVVDVGVLLQRIGGQHQEAGRAEAALQPVMRDEGALQRMQRVAGGETLHGANLAALRLHREHQAGAHRVIVEDHRAGSADAVLAADMGAGLPAILADRIDQRLARLHPDGVIAPIDGERDIDLFTHFMNGPGNQKVISINALWAEHP